MLAFILRRALQSIGVMIAVGIISFAMFRFAGDPVNQMVALDTSPAQRAEIRASLGLDDPVVVQFARYFGNAVQFKFGVSYQFRQPVSSLDQMKVPSFSALKSLVRDTQASEVWLAITRLAPVAGSTDSRSSVFWSRLSRWT